MKLYSYSKLGSIFISLFALVTLFAAVPAFAAQSTHKSTKHHAPHGRIVHRSAKCPGGGGGSNHSLSAGYNGTPSATQYVDTGPSYYDLVDWELDFTNVVAAETYAANHTPFADISAGWVMYRLITEVAESTGGGYAPNSFALGLIGSDSDVQVDSGGYNLGTFNQDVSDIMEKSETQPMPTWLSDMGTTASSSSGLWIRVTYEYQIFSWYYDVSGVFNMTVVTSNTLNRTQQVSSLP